MMFSPDDYIGKTIKMTGLYSPIYFSETDKNYHYVLIEDALACCAQGIEFVWGDDTYIYPDDYPLVGANIEVTGVFETYREEGDSYLYCRLVNSSLIIK